MISIFVSFWTGFGLMAAGAAIDGGPGPALAVLGIGAIIQAVVLVLRKC